MADYNSIEELLEGERGESVHVECGRDMAEDPVVGGVSFKGNRLYLPDAPGLGISDVRGWQEICRIG